MRSDQVREIDAERIGDGGEHLGRAAALAALQLRDVGPANAGLIARAGLGSCAGMPATPASGARRGEQRVGDGDRHRLLIGLRLRPIIDARRVGIVRLLQQVLPDLVPHDDIGRLAFVSGNSAVYPS